MQSQNEEIEIAPAPNMGMINFLYSMGKIAIAKAKERKKAFYIYQLGMAGDLEFVMNLKI